MLDIDQLIESGRIVIGGTFNNSEESNQVIAALKNIASVSSGQGFIEQMISSGNPFQIINDSRIFLGNAAGPESPRSMEEAKLLLNDNKIYINNAVHGF